MINGTRLHAQTTPGGGVPVVFLHGFGGSAQAWDRIVAAIAPDYATLAYDLPGHGRSIAADGIGGGGRMAKAVGADLTQRGIARLHLVGHSMGGAVATLVALRMPERIASLTLLAPGGFGPEINHRLLCRYARAATADDMRLVLENMFGWSRPISQAQVDAALELRHLPGAVEALEAILPAMVTGEGLSQAQGTIPRDQLAELSERLDGPAKVLWGTQDRVLPTRQAHKLPPLFAAHVFDDTGHMLIEEQEEAVIALIRQNIRMGG
jgi:pimeloyl-ACP methyl ester carboxylesterase